MEGQISFGTSAIHSLANIHLNTLASKLVQMHPHSESNKARYLCKVSTEENWISRSEKRFLVHLVPKKCEKVERTDHRSLQMKNIR